MSGKTELKLLLYKTCLPDHQALWTLGGSHMGGCQNSGSFLGYPKYQVPYYNEDPKRDPKIDNHPTETLNPKPFI